MSGSSEIPRFGRRAPKHAEKFDRWKTSYNHQFVGPRGFIPANVDIKPSIRDAQHEKVDHSWDVGTTQRYQNAATEIGSFVDKSTLDYKTFKKVTGVPVPHGFLGQGDAEGGEWCTTTDVAHGKRSGLHNAFYERAPPPPPARGPTGGGISMMMKTAGMESRPYWDEKTGFPIRPGKKILKSNTYGEIVASGGLGMGYRSRRGTSYSGSSRGGSVAPSVAGSRASVAGSRAPSMAGSCFGTSRSMVMEAEARREGGEEAGVPMLAIPEA